MNENSPDSPSEPRDWSESETYFNDQIRNVTVELLVFGILLTVAHFELKKWRRPMEVELPVLNNLSDVHDVKLKKENKDDHLIYRLAQLTCTFAFSTGLSCTILLPLSVLCNEIKVFCSQSCPDWWLEWLTAELVVEAWNRVSLMTSVFLFLVLPFIFFLTEADGFSFGPRSGLKAKIYETTITFILLIILIAAFFFVLLKFLGAFSISSTWSFFIAQMVLEVTPMLRTFFSLLAILALLLAVPFGQQMLLDKATEAIIMVTPKSSVRSELRRATVELEGVRRRLTHRHRVRRASATPGELKEREKLLKADISKLQFLANQSFFTRFFCRPLYLIGSVTLIGMGIICAAFRTLQICLPSFFESDIAPLRFSSIHFGVTSFAKNFGYLCHLVSGLKFCLAVWLTVSGFIGFLSKMPKSWRPRLEGTPLHKLILQCFLFLLLCSAVPLLGALLTGLPLPIKFSGSPALIGSTYQFFACAYYALYSIFSICRTLTSRKREQLYDSFRNAWESTSPLNSPMKKRV